MPNFWDSWKKTNFRGADSVKDIPFEVATVYLFDEPLSGGPGTWKLPDSAMIGATTTGSNIKITPSFVTVAVDGAGATPVRGLKIPNGGTCEITANMAEINDKYAGLALIADSEAATDTAGYTKLTPKSYLKDEDFASIVMIAYNTAGEPTLCFRGNNALCTSGITVNTAPSKNNPIPVKWELMAGLDGDLKTLDYNIWVPSTTAG